MLGSCSGSGKLVFEHYEKLVFMWGGSVNIEPLSFGISSGELDDEHQEFSVDLGIQEDNNDEYVDNNQDESDSEPNVELGIVYKLQRQQIQENVRWVVRLYQD